MEEKQKDKTSKFLLLLLLLLSLTTTTTSTRPQLVKSDVWVSENRIVSTDFQTISGNLEFDQPLYLAESILCPRAEEVRKERGGGRGGGEGGGGEKGEELIFFFVFGGVW